MEKSDDNKKSWIYREAAMYAGRIVQQEKSVKAEWIFYIDVIWHQKENWN